MPNTLLHLLRNNILDEQRSFSKQARSKFLLKYGFVCLTYTKMFKIDISAEYYILQTLELDWKHEKLIRELLNLNATILKSMNTKSLI